MNIGGKSVNPNIFIKAISQTITKSIQAQKKNYLAPCVENL